MLKAKELAKEGYLVTFGITPTHPNTGYGYIECVVSSEQLVADVTKFHEKPDINTAKEYLQQNTTNYPLPTTNYLWNSGMFMFKAGVYLEDLKKHSPEIYEKCEKAYNKSKNTIHHSPPTTNFLRLTNMQDIPNISIDYAVMEKSDKIKVIKAEFDWNDVGSFDSLIEEVMVDSDGDNRSKNNKAEKIEIDSKNNFYFSDKNKLIATIGLEDFIVIDTNDALLISKKGQTQKVKEIVRPFNPPCQPSFRTLMNGFH